MAAIVGVVGMTFARLIRGQAPTIAGILQQSAHTMIGATVLEASQLIDQMQKDYEEYQAINDVSVKDWSPSEPHVCCGKGL